MVDAEAFVSGLFFLGCFGSRGFWVLFGIESRFGGAAALAGLFFFFGVFAAMSVFAHARAPCFFPA